MTSPKKLLAALNLRPKKKFGQHFLLDPSTAEMIAARCAILPEEVALEIGVGLGALTIPLARAARKVYAIEKDSEVIPLLTAELSAHRLDNVVLLNENILDVDLKKVAQQEKRKIVVVGNLPYNISSQVLVQLIKSRSVVSRAVLMFQKELAQRITASPGGKNYGRLSVMLQYCAEIKTLARVDACLFYPKPKVASEVLGITFKTIPEYSIDDEAFFFKVIKAAFSKRRKTLKNALAGSQLHLDMTAATRSLERAGIDPVRRAETLTVPEFVALSRELEPALKLFRSQELESRSQNE